MYTHTAAPYSPVSCRYIKFSILQLFHSPIRLYVCSPGSQHREWCVCLSVGLTVMIVIAYAKYYIMHRNQFFLCAYSRLEYLLVRHVVALISPNPNHTQFWSGKSHQSAKLASMMTFSLLFFLLPPSLSVTFLRYMHSECVYLSQMQMLFQIKYMAQ